MDGYLIDLDGLAGLIDNLDTAADRMTVANNRLRDASAHDLGSHAIDQAGGQFRDRWEYGTKKIAEATDEMVQSLRDTRRLYQDVEHQVCRLFPAEGAGTGAGVPSAAPNLGSPISSALAGDR